MSDPYYQDLDSVTVEEFFDTLRKGNIAPSRLILTENKRDTLAAIRGIGIASLGELAEAVKTKTRVGEFVKRTGLDEAYVTILRRQALSYLPQPVSLAKIPGVEGSVVEALAAQGIVQGKQLIERCASAEDRLALSHQTDVEIDEIVRLVRVANFTRITGVGPLFADLFVRIGIGGLTQLSEEDPRKHADRVAGALDSIGYTGAPVTDWDIDTYLVAARKLPKIIDFDQA